MSLKNLKINEKRVQKSRKILLCLVCTFCVSFAGCESDSIPVTVQPQQENVTQPTENLHSVNFTAKQIERLNSIPQQNVVERSVSSYQTENSTRQSAFWGGTNLTGKNRPPVLTNLPGPETPRNNQPRSKTQDTRLKTQDPRSKSQDLSLVSGVWGLENDRPVTTSDRPSPEFRSQRVSMSILDKPGMADELISVNFDRVDIRTVLKTIGDIAGINFVVEDSVRGTVTVMFPTKIRLGDVYKVLESILEVQGYAAVPAENLVKIVPRAEAVKRNLQVRVGSNPAEIPENDSIVTQIIPLSYADATEVSQIIQPLLPTGSQMATYPRTNSIVITDTSSNIHHIAKIIQELDVTGSKEQVIVFGLKHASAQVLSDQITRIMQKSRDVSPQTGRTRSIPRIETEMKILPDARTNSLVVVANAQDIKTIEGLKNQLDVPRPIGTDNVHVVYLQNADANEVSRSLTAALAGLKIAGTIEGIQQVQVTADAGTNALIITASVQDYEIIAKIIEKLDIVREQVLVEMLIMEVSEDALEEIGIDWATFDQAVAGSVRFFGATNFGPRVDFVSGNFKGLSVGAWKRTNSGVSIGAILHALGETSGVNILSTPHILTSNHHKAKIIVGESIPFVMQSRITETDPATPTSIKTFEYRDVGIILDIIPHISQSGLIRLEIDSEFTKFIDTGSIDTQRTTKRQAQTNVTMNSGSTVVIGGLIRDDKITFERKIPLVGDIPLVGELFKLRREQLQKTNLLIFITPHILSSQEDLEQITEEKKKEMMPTLQDFQEKNGQD